MADGVLGDQQLAGQPDQPVDPLDIDPQGRVGRAGPSACPAPRAPSPRGRSGSGRSPSPSTPRRRPAGWSAAGFRGRSRPGPDAAAHSPPPGRPIPGGPRRPPSSARREAAFAPREAAGRQPTGRQRPLPAARCPARWIGAASRSGELGEAADEIVRRRVGTLGNVAARLHQVDPRADLVETGKAKIDQGRR